MLIVTIPPELIYIIIEYINIRDIRVLNKIEAFKYYRPIFQNFIKRENDNILNFYTNIQQTEFENNLIFDINNLKLGFIQGDNFGRWGAFIKNVNIDKHQFYVELLKTNNNIEKRVQNYFKIIRIMVEKYGNNVTDNFASPCKYRPRINELLDSLIRRFNK